MELSLNKTPPEKNFKYVLHEGGDKTEANSQGICKEVLMKKHIFNKQTKAWANLNQWPNQFACQAIKVGGGEKKSLALSQFTPFSCG